MELGVWRLLLDEDLPPSVREALTIADRSASPELSRRALWRAAEELVDQVGLSAEEAAALMGLSLRSSPVRQRLERPARLVERLLSEIEAACYPPVKATVE